MTHSGQQRGYAARTATTLVFLRHGDSSARTPQGMTSTVMLFSVKEKHSGFPGLKKTIKGI